MDSVPVLMALSILALLGLVIWLWADNNRIVRRGNIDREWFNQQIVDLQSKVDKAKGEQVEMRKQVANIPERVKHVAIAPFDESKPEYVKVLGQMAMRPEWLFFMWQMEQQAMSACKGAKSLEDQRRAIAWVEAFDLIVAKLAGFVEQYNALTRIPEDNDGEISLS